MLREYTLEEKLDSLVCESKARSNPNLYNITTVQISIKFLIDLQKKIMEG